MADSLKDGSAPAVKIARAVIALPSGMSVTVSGEAVSMDDVIFALGEAGKEAERGRDQNLDVKTFFV